MVKIFAIIYLSAVIMSVYGCYGNKIAPDKPAPSPAATSDTDIPTPVVTAVPTVPAVVPISEFTTIIYDNEAERVNNIVLAAEAINGVMVKNGSVFSFNDTVGMRTRKKGYKEATVLVGKEKTKGLGGGVCQVSTTLYQAAKNGGFVIVERHRHEVEVSYAPGGTDASVNYDNLDFKFRNNSGNDIKITAYSDGESVTVQIFNIQ